MCGKDFSARDESYRFCSHSCYAKYQWKNGLIKHKLTGKFIKCKICEKSFYIPKHKFDKALFCSNNCKRDAMKKNMFGFQPSKYGRTKYKHIVTENGEKTREHRYIMEKHLGRKLHTWEHVHHIDGNGLNNSISNLIVLTNSEHQKTHKRVIKSTNSNNGIG